MTANTFESAAHAAKNGPSGAWLTSVARTPPNTPNTSA